MSLDEDVQSVMKGDDINMGLIKISIPNRDRNECLQTLHRMNINHLSLFPDLSGSAYHCNRLLEIDDY